MHFEILIEDQSGKKVLDLKDGVPKGKGFNIECLC